MATDEPHHVRITTHGKIRTWVRFAIKYFESHPSTPLLLHTRSKTQHATIAVVPRLISVAEIIKREYLKQLREHDRDGPTWSGLYQYNELISEEIAVVDSEPNGITEALQGKNFPKQKQTAIMTITLCRIPLPHLEEKGATCQTPLAYQLCKAAKARARRRKRKAKPLEAAS